MVQHNPEGPRHLQFRQTNTSIGLCPDASPVQKATFLYEDFTGLGVRLVQLVALWADERIGTT
jgi:hypothetical protein